MKILKRLVIAVLLVGVLAFSANAIINIAVEQSITTSYSEIFVPSWTHGKSCIPIAAWTDDGTAFYIAQDNIGTGVRFIPANATYSNDCVKPNSDGSLMWVKSVENTTLYVDIGRSR